MLAADGGHTLTVKALIGGGADPNIQNRVSGICFSITIILSGISMNYRIAGKFRGVPKFVIFVVQFESRN